MIQQVVISLPSFSIFILYQYLYFLYLDVTRQIPFEINPAFFPPPTISLPPDDVTPPGNFDVSLHILKFKKLMIFF